MNPTNVLRKRAPTAKEGAHKAKEGTHKAKEGTHKGCPYYCCQ